MSCQGYPTLPVLKSFMRQVAIIEAHGVPWNFWIFIESAPLGRFDLVVAMSVCMYVCLSLLPIYALMYMFAPTSRSRMSKIFRDSESLGKSSGKKWSQNWTFLLGSGLKSQCKKKFVFCWFCLTKHGWNHASKWIRDLWSKGITLILAYL